MMILYTLSIVPLNVRNHKSSSLLALVLNNSAPNNVSSTDSSRLYPVHWIVIDIPLMIYMLYVAIVLFQELYQLGRLIHLLRRKHPGSSSLHINPNSNNCYGALLIVYGIFTLVSYPLYHTNNIAAHIPQIIGLVLGWVFLMFFTRAWKPFSIFTVIMQSAFVDIARFAVMYIVILVPFSAAMTILFQSASEDHSFSDLHRSLLEMFQLTLGLTDIDTKDATYPELAILVYISYLTMTYVLLLNMVIAVLSDTCSRVTSNRQSQWHLQKLGIILSIETRVPQNKRLNIGMQADADKTKSPNRHYKAERIKSKYLKVTSMIDPMTD